MTTEQQVRILSIITTRNEAGRHFTSIHSYADLLALESEGLITIDRPVHEATGIPYDQQYWSVEATPDGVATVESYPEYWDEAACD